MLFIEKGRVVVPCLKTKRTKRAVITGILDATFVVLLKNNAEYEVAPISSFMLTDEVIDISNMTKEQIAEKLKVEEVTDCSNDFERFKMKLVKEAEQKVLEENKLI